MARRLRLLLVLLIIALPVVATVHAAYVGPQLHDVRLSALGPAVVVQAAVDAAAGDRGVRLEALATESTPEVATAQARALVLAGDSDAAVVIDLAGSTDLLVVPDYRSDGFVRALLAQVSPVSSGFGRELEVDRVRGADAASSGSAAAVLLCGWVALGLLVAAVATALRGPVPASEDRAALRLLVLAVTGAVLGGLVAVAAHLVWSTPMLPVALSGAAAITLAGWLTTAAENVLGLPGLAVAAALGTGPLTTLLLDDEPDTLPAPWDRLRLVLPHDAAYALATSVTQQLDGALWRPMSLLLAWTLIALLVMAAAYRWRPSPAR